MKKILLIISILLLVSCGGGSSEKAAEPEDVANEPGIFNLHNVRFDAKDYYEGEQVTVTKGTNFEVQWVSPTSEAYRIDLYLSINDEVHSDRNKIVGLRCGNASFSLCPNAVGEVQCEVNDNSISCSVGSKSFQDEHLSNLKLIIRGCDAFSNCDIKTFNLLIENNTGG